MNQQVDKCQLTILTGADVQRSSDGAVFGDQRIPTEAFVVRVDRGGGQGVRLQAEAVHFNALQIHALRKAC